MWLDNPTFSPLKITKANRLDARANALAAEQVTRSQTHSTTLRRPEQMTRTTRRTNQASESRCLPIRSSRRQALTPSRPPPEVIFPATTQTPQGVCAVKLSEIPVYPNIYLGRTASFNALAILALTTVFAGI